MTDQQNDGGAKAIESDQDVGTAAWGEAWMRRAKIVESELEAVRLELDEVNSAWHERWTRDQKLIEKLNHDSVEAAEQLSIERARAEEAERLREESRALAMEWIIKAGDLEFMLNSDDGAAGEIKHLKSELAAAHTRAGRLENALLDVCDVAAVDPLAYKDILSASPQASAHACTGADCARCKLTHVCRKCGEMNTGACATCDATPQASTEQGLTEEYHGQGPAGGLRKFTSPIPQVAQASEPLPEYITRGELAAALRWTAAAYTAATTPPAALVELADRLEGK
jgi:hypothetical protein